MREAGQQDRQRDLVRRPLALGAFDERDHAVEERLAGIGRDADDELVADDRRAAGDGAADVGARLLEHRRGLAGDRGLVDEADALDDVAVAGDRLALGTTTTSPLRSSDEPTSSSVPSARRRCAIVLRARPAQRRRLGRPRASATASA